MTRLRDALSNTFSGSSERATQPLSGAYVDAAELNQLRHSPVLRKRRNRQVQSSQSGSRATKLRGRGVDFAEVRAYQPGDDIRNIDWRVTARKNMPHTKVFREERERPSLVIVDQTHSLFFGSQRRLKSVAAAHCAALAAWGALAENDRVGGLVLNLEHGELHQPKHSATAVARFVTAIAKANQALNRQCRRLTQAQLEAQLDIAQRWIKSNYRVYVISDFLPSNDFWIDRLKGLARHNDVSALRIFDPLERTLPNNDLYTVTDGTAHQRFDAGSSRLREAYATRFDQWDEQLRSQLSSVGIRYTSLATNATDMKLQEWM